jgi:hypothetical protein
MLIVLAGTLASSGALIAQDEAGPEKKDQKTISLRLKANPHIAFSPAKIAATAELKGESDDTYEYYCLSLEWDWGDGTKSESHFDCPPFEPGKSTIERRFRASHTFQRSGQYRVLLRLRRGTQTILSGNVNVEVKPGFETPPVF